MKVDMREHKAIRDQVHAGLSALLVQGRQIWGADELTLADVVIRLMVGVGDLARQGAGVVDTRNRDAWERDLKKKLGNVLFSTIRWIDDLGLDVLECLDLAIEAQEKFAKSGRPR